MDESGCFLFDMAPTFTPTPSNTLWLGSCALLAPSISNSQKAKGKERKNPWTRERERDRGSSYGSNSFWSQHFRKKKVGALMWLGCEREGEVIDVPSVSWMYMLVTIGNQTSHVKGALYRYVLLNTRACTTLAPPSASSGPILFSHSFYKRIKSRGH